jgi:hypothetical protein
MRLTILTTLLCLNLCLYSQENANISLDVESYDVSRIWLTEYPITKWLTEPPVVVEEREYKQPEPVGYFGEKYYRFYIHLISIVQNQEDKSEYFVYGKNKLKGNISEFQGTIKIENAELFNSGITEGVNEGTLKGSYTFYEDPKKSGTGQFQGVFETYIMTVNNELHYNTVSWFADGFCNNQFEGTWTSYSTGTEYVCNWGDYRIPNRRGFDIGAGQMGVNSEFIKNGWENFELATFPIANSDEHRKQIDEAKKKEAEEWWK